MNKFKIKKTILFALFMMLFQFSEGQVMTPELLWSLERVSPYALSTDGKTVYFYGTTYNIKTNQRHRQLYKVKVRGGRIKAVKSTKNKVRNASISPDGRYQILAKSVKVKDVYGKDIYPDMQASNVMIYDDLNYRHWDTWEDGEYNHLFLKSLANPTAKLVDLMEGQPYSTPTEPFGGAEDFTWNKDGSKIIYVSKKQFGTDYAISTNTDIFEYDIVTKQTKNLTEENKGYDTMPAFSAHGMLAYLQMDEPGYEADKNDIIVLKKNGQKVNLTQFWNETVFSFHWSNDGSRIFFVAPKQGTIQLFEVNVQNQKIRQITSGQFDVTGIVGQSKKKIIVGRRDMNHATELFSVETKNGKMKQISHQNDHVYVGLKLGEVKKRMIRTTDGKQMLAWVIYPPNFDPTKKYPTLLYTQGGPQSPLSQFYSFRWNFQLMAANGYIVIAPNRRGMPGHGVEWNEQISGDWGGQNIRDYLSAIDDISKESYVDKDRLGCVGASYGGYSAFYLAGVHNNRFKTFIAHDGIFNTRSMYGTTEELFFVNKDFGGAYWNTPTPKAYTDFNPINHVNKWNTPILIIQGGRDYRVPIGQSLEAFQAAQLQGVKSRLLYFPEENHWILSPQNGIVWQREFYKWLQETLVNN